MKALILNSGAGVRLRPLTETQPKCMTKISPEETILGRHLRQLADVGVEEIVITTGPFERELVQYAEAHEEKQKVTFVKNPEYDRTNYIYSIFCAREYLEGDILLLHGDLVFADEVLRRVMDFDGSCMVTSSAVPLPEKDFKAVLSGEYIKAIGIEFFEHAVAAQPLYKLLRKDWQAWLSRIEMFCRNGRRNCYAENAFNEISNQCRIHPLEVGNLFCEEVDSLEDLDLVVSGLRTLDSEDSAI